MQFASSPLAGEGGWMQQRVQQTDDAIVVELKARDASLADEGRLGEVRQEAGVDGGRQEIGLQGEACGDWSPPSCCRNAGRLSSRRPTPKWRLSLEQVSARRMQSPRSITADVVLGE